MLMSDTDRVSAPEPEPSRPHMPGYGLLGPAEGTGLLPWSWAHERLAASHDYWLATARAEGRPHLMPVWGVWDGVSLWFSSANDSRKASNLRSHPRCSVATDNAYEPVVIEGDASVVTDLTQLRRALALENEKYGTDYGDEMLDRDHNTWFELRPVWAFALDEHDFTGSPTRWTFPGGRQG
jgi:nitroimidazol reductase NimA-like FMN-containing flavoprotein (pyridoxamine 5'-phosphate oxidase superfamily)